jgi:hypothetical protein
MDIKNKISLLCFSLVTITAISIVGSTVYQKGILNKNIAEEISKNVLREAKQIASGQLAQMAADLQTLVKEFKY